MELTERLTGLGSDTMEAILDNLPTGLVFCDRDCIIRYINKPYAEYLEVTIEEAVGKPITEYIPGSRAVNVMESGMPELGDRCPLGKDSQKTLIVNRIPVRDRDGDVIGMVSQALFGDVEEIRVLSGKIERLGKKVTTYEEKLRTMLSTRYCIDDIKGQSAGITRAKAYIGHYAKTDSPVLIMGATGTGKELFANALHTESMRSEGPFVCINCAAFPFDLIESELFGYAPGAFTGAQKGGKMGQIELADKGTLFLDEIGDMPLHAQVKLLRVLEEKIVFRLGSTVPRKVDFRLTAATNRDLMALIAEGKFREDLFYRLSTMTVSIPSLRERREDIPLLVHDILERLRKKNIRLSPEAMDVLIGYDWPGNVRELRNVVERATSLCDDCTIRPGELPSEIIRDSYSADKQEEKPHPSLLHHSLNTTERKFILDAVRKNGGNIVRTARMLGISRAAFYEKMKKHGIRRKDIMPQGS